MKFGYVSLCCGRSDAYRDFESFLQYANDTKVTEHPCIVTEPLFKNVIVDKFSTILPTINPTALYCSLVNPNSITRLRGRNRNIPINMFFMTVEELNEKIMLEVFSRFDTVNVLVNSIEFGMEHKLSVMANRIDVKYEEYEKYLSPFTYSLLRHMDFID